MTVQDSKNNANPSSYKRNSLSLNAKVGGALNPDWVEWLMGFPQNWSEVEYVKSKYQKNKSKIDSFNEMQDMRNDGESSETSPRHNGCEDSGCSLSEMSQGTSSKEWNLGKEEIKKGESLCCLRKDVHAISQQEREQDMQQGMPEYIRQNQCTEEMGSWAEEPDIPRIASGVKNRVHRIKCLGNAVVPQLAEVFAQAIKEYEIKQ